MAEMVTRTILAQDVRQPTALISVKRFIPKQTGNRPQSDVPTKKHPDGFRVQPSIYACTYARISPSRYFNPSTPSRNCQFPDTVCATVRCGEGAAPIRGRPYSGGANGTVLNAGAPAIDLCMRPNRTSLTLAIPAARSGPSRVFISGYLWEGSPIKTKLQTVWLDASPSPVFLDQLYECWSNEFGALNQPLAVLNSEVEPFCRLIRELGLGEEFLDL